ncbi:MAG TPA: alpha/beta hydrolase [Ferruginibacter sp.]|nr:alpha/beta hydrolase [Ferruginibacter sp.]
MLHRYTLILFLFGTSLFSCSKSDDTSNGTGTAAKTMLNVSYGSAALQNMDIYLPANRNSNTKVMFIIHGGGWSGGDKSDMNPYVDTMKRRKPDYAIININYRLALSGSNLFPTQENDVKQAIEFIYTHRNEYTISDRFVLVGASAGGHLALLQGYKYDAPVKPKAIIDFFGPTDMKDMYEHPVLTGGDLPILAVMGATPQQDSLLYAHSSPINYVSATCPPTMILQGGADVIVNPLQSQTLYARLQLAGIPAQLAFYPSQGHGWIGPDLTDSFNQIDAFLNSYVP